MKDLTHEELADFCLGLMNKYGIRMPETYSEQELIDYNPEIPVDFIKNHIKERDNT